MVELNCSSLGRHTSIRSVDDVLRRVDQLAAQACVEGHDLRAELVLKSLKLIDSGGDIAPVEGGNGGRQTHQQRLLAPGRKCRILHQPNQNGYGIRGLNHFHGHVRTADAEREGIVKS